MLHNLVTLLSCLFPWIWNSSWHKGAIGLDFDLKINLSPVSCSWWRISFRSWKVADRDALSGESTRWTGRHTGRHACQCSTNNGEATDLPDMSPKWHRGFSETRIVIADDADEQIGQRIMIMLIYSYSGEAVVSEAQEVHTVKRSFFPLCSLICRYLF